MPPMPAVGLNPPAHATRWAGSRRGQGMIGRQRLGAPEGEPWQYRHRRRSALGRGPRGRPSTSRQPSHRHHPRLRLGAGTQRRRQSAESASGPRRRRVGAVPTKRTARSASRSRCGAVEQVVAATRAGSTKLVGGLQTSLAAAETDVRAVNSLSERTDALITELNAVRAEQAKRAGSARRAARLRDRPEPPCVPEPDHQSPQDPRSCGHPGALGLVVHNLPTTGRRWQLKMPR
jgi:hypothetical protein